MGKMIAVRLRDGIVHQLDSDSDEFKEFRAWERRHSSEEGVTFKTLWAFDCDTIDDYVDARYFGMQVELVDPDPPRGAGIYDMDNYDFQKVSIYRIKTEDEFDEDNYRIGGYDYFYFGHYANINEKPCYGCPLRARYVINWAVEKGCLNEVLGAPIAEVEFDCDPDPKSISKGSHLIPEYEALYEENGTYYLYRECQLWRDGEIQNAKKKECGWFSDSRATDWARKNLPLEKYKELFSFRWEHRNPVPQDEEPILE